MRLVSDVLDEQLKDRDGENAGRVDGIVLSLHEGKPPLVSYLEVSPITLLSRFSRRLAWWYARHDRRFGAGRGVPVRIPWSRVTRDGPTLKMDLDVEATPINALEDWLRVHIVDHIPRSVDVNVREVHVEHLVGRKVRDAEGAIIGRLEELEVKIVDGEPVVVEFHVGPAALLERWGGFLLELPFFTLLPIVQREYRIPWQLMDLSDVKHPVVRAAKRDLPRASS